MSTHKIITKILDSVENLKEKYPYVCISIFSMNDKDSDGLRLLLVVTNANINFVPDISFILHGIKEDIKYDHYRPVSYQVEQTPLIPKSIAEKWTLEAVI